MSWAGPAVLKSRKRESGDLNGRMQAGDAGHDLVHRIRVTARRQVARQPEGKLQLHHAHPIRAEREPCRAAAELARQQPPRQRPIHTDMRLSGLTGGGNLPTRNGLSLNSLASLA